ncbi:MAG TPA: UDP-N-acetylmuramoyl-L-alanyl-D-glutamate--2,6-diaminopimelate ligase [Planctomycetaceae bacterium]|nr:UDP-N-acetylmuramoyl-L-alanyl-D-glutamate--2,6-diaminopimelate ligase [Planctomycetaceae bacterium]
MDRPPASCKTPVSLRPLFPTAQFLGGVDIFAADAVEHSRDCHADAVFAVIRGTKTNGAMFVREALSYGVAGLLVDHPIAEAPVTQCIVPDVRRAFAELSASLAGNPSEELDVVGVTGTNGKTTVTWMVRAILQRSGRLTGVLGTIEYSDGVQTEPSHLTTPDSRTLQCWLGRMVTNGANAAAMELSSHALHQGRAAGTNLAAGVVTNITQDHFDYHQHFEAYRSSKARIVDMVRTGGIIALNADDPGSWSLRDGTPSTCQMVSFGCTPSCDVSAQILEESRLGTRFRLGLHGRSQECSIALLGRHNVSNALAAAAAAAHLGVSLEDIVVGLEQFRGVPGRMERIDCGQSFDVVIDYAHTDDALRRCLASVRGLTAGRVICVFGAGGDRDASKRPLLGRAASAADIAVVTSDNPRSEPPLGIIHEIAAGMTGSADCVMEPDRQRAIAIALSWARPGDCVVIAGKGHEREQIIGRERFPFDDRAVARAVLQRLRGSVTEHRRSA